MVRTMRSHLQNLRVLASVLLLFNCAHWTNSVQNKQDGQIGFSNSASPPGSSDPNSNTVSQTGLLTAPVGGPNVCRSRHKTYCCPGWTQKPNSGLCVIPICRPCGPGRCVKPNICLCDGGTVAPNCSESRGSDGRRPGQNLIGPGPGPGGQGNGGPGTSLANGGCRIPCLNGGTCSNAKCVCKAGFQGEFCGEPVCREPCLNSGRCIGPDRCACVYGYTGRRCESDYRTGPCYTKTSGNTCGGQLLGVVCTRNLCCATVGKAWGHPCEPCPTHLDCEHGYLKNVHSGVCIDVDECEAIPGICEGGRCVNTPGGFKCACPPGQIPKEGTSGPCVDENECLVPGTCNNGRCVNTASGYYCLCDRGFIPTQDQKLCIDARQGNCFTSVLRGLCRGKLSVRLTKRDCCCGVNMGKGWGDENNCDVCPSSETNGYKALCADAAGPGQIAKVDECGLRPDICGNGKCVDLVDGYRCECSAGYSQKTPMSQCEDLDECRLNAQNGLCQGGRCVNTQGSYTCICPTGFDVSSDGRFCIDHDECTENGMCANGICINMDGSFKCQCKDGFVLSPTGHSCIDVDECFENPRICLSGRCENTIGSYKCVCLDGFTPSTDQAFCVDRDECVDGMCENGRCLNMDGSFRCVCNPGFKLGPLGRNCIDLNECESAPCSGGRCVNTKGSYKCECLPGFSIGPDGTTCLDTQRDLCYAQYRDGICTAPSSAPVPRSACCCCSVVFGQPMGWGTPCRPCPMPNTPEFDLLCPHGPGMTHSGDDINECTNSPGICGPNGACENVPGTFRCVCEAGFEVDPSGKPCIDVNECMLDNFLCGGGQCKNTPGSFQCICPLGTEYDSRTQVCQDVNECSNQVGACPNGRCLNTVGSFQCQCNEGFVLDNSGRLCIDNRKGNCWTKHVAGKCEGNLKRLMSRNECCCSNGVGTAWGSPCEPCDTRLCECAPGFAKLDGKTCVDVNECDLNPLICYGGGTCVNTEGGFTCTCPPGLQLEAGGTRCVDRREELCYMQVKRGECSHALEGHYLRTDCCCTVGRAWGRDCLQCPRPGSEMFAQLCPRGIGTGSGRKDINECTMIPGICENGRCRNTIGSYTCRCNQGYALDEDGIKCIDINECSIMGGVCGNGTCRNIPGSFACDCEEGFESTMAMQVCMDVDECIKTPGLCRGGRCVNTVGSFRCDCPPGLELAPNQRECKDIDECSRSSGICSNGICENMMGTFQCDCFEGYEPGSNRAHCEDIDECSVNNGGCQSACLNTPGSYTCACAPGYMLLLDGKTCTDVDECRDNSRVCNGGKCENTPGSYQCECTKGLLPSPDDSTCLDQDECRADPLICGEAGRCENAMGTFNCHCEDGFSVRPELGPACVDEDECLIGNFNCAHNAECVNTEGAYECRCEDGFTGDGHTCRDINECQVNNGGCHPDAQCINTDGSFRCACDVGYEGDGYNCIDVDECSNNPNLCEHGQCLNQPGSFTCECDHGFMNRDPQKHSCIDIDECGIFPEICFQGRCENILGAFRCSCNKGYRLDSGGGNCTDIDECESPQACMYGTCINRPGSYICECLPEYELVESGNACVDRRKSNCYLDAEDGRGRQLSSTFRRRECTRPVGDLMTRASCCCSVGVNWGPHCEPCPVAGSEDYNFLCAGGNGFRPNGNTVVLEDIDECSEIAHVCAHGKCTNTFGSFICSCDPGYRLDFTKAMCIDIEECIEDPGICGVGDCVNDEGGYHCLCPPGYMLLPSGRECVDMRKEPCYMELNVTTLKCAHPMGTRQTRMLCCCSMGAAWGEACLPCPNASTPEYSLLCGFKPGQIVNPVTGLPEGIDECALMPQLCRNGICINTPSSFRCDCYRGFVYDEVLHTCVDDNECSRSPSPCQGNAQCINVPGSFECRCPEGYHLDHSRRRCADTNECTERQGVCNYGSCNNYQGSFQCICRPGFTLTPGRDSCVDLDECLKSVGICGNGTCINMLGSYKCNCHAGFRLSPNGDCEDIDECQVLSGNGKCRNGRCRNTEGSFTCQCADGYVLTPDGQNCRDIEECLEVPNTCPPPGTCQNVMGSYICSCPNGYEVSPDGNYCLDLDECTLNSKLCIDGTCINTEGGFRCDCPPNFVLSPDGKRCIDTRQDFCYDGIQVSGQFGRPTCTSPRRGYLSRASCCCTGGRAFSSTCEQCPAQGTSDFEKLCPEGPGRTSSGQDLDECSLLVDICEGGECVNTDGSFRCECPPGYRLDGTMRKCVDEDECQSAAVCGNGTCFNTEGGFECSCAEGFMPGATQACEDINECLERRHQCAFRCHNTLGSYKCGCPFGYALAPDGKHCNDLDECGTSNNCKFLCKNLIGSFMCICPDGFQQVGSGDDCRDINECLLDSTLCTNGRCINVQGSYRCDCFDGYEPSSDFSECIDKRQGFCFRHMMGGQCSSRDLTALAKTTKLDCCCTLGSAWQASPRSLCEPCPKSGSTAYSQMCTETGFDAAGQDINECDILPDLCKHGTCINTMGSYRCMCHKGYKTDVTGTRCVDLNECDQSKKLCSHICQNTDGSYICACPAGFVLGGDGITCKDVDECSIGRPCPNECVNTQGSYKCTCSPGYSQEGDQCLDLNECEQGVCGPPGTCINTLGSYKCICPRGFTPDPSGTRCVDSNECGDDSRCQHGCQNAVGGYRCQCPEGYGQHYYYNQCMDEDECLLEDICGTAQCRNTVGSYQCQCPNGQQFDPVLLRCVQLSGSCVGSPCAFGCSSHGNGFSCGCPQGYRHIGQGHCLSTITPPAYGAYIGEDLSFEADKSDQYIATEGCFSCKVGAASRRSRRSISSNVTTFDRSENEVMTKHHTAVDDQLILVVPMEHTRPRYRILQLQPAVKQMSQIRYSIVRGNEFGLFEVSGESPAVLHFRRKTRTPRTYDLELFGYSTDPSYYEKSRKDPFTLRIRLVITN